MPVSVFYTDHNGPALYAQEPQPPFTRCILEYLNEGGANFVFRILPGSSGEELPSSLRHRLLRLRKNLPHVRSAQEQIAAFEQHFVSLFPAENLVQHELISIGDGVIALVNDNLANLSRHPRRAQDELPLDETHALLITDMTPDAGIELLQFKPKWLAQSSNAPLGAIRCRTCALRAMRTSQQIRTATDAQQSCSLAFVSPDIEERKRTARLVTDDVILQDSLVNDALPLLEKLRACQRKLDPVGVLGEQDQSTTLDLCKAMTLRDCTMFLKRSEIRVEIRLADLDLKQTDKLHAWKEAETSLVADGWYTNTEAKEKWNKETVCLLSRHVK